MCGLVIRDDVQLMAADVTKTALDKGLLLVGAGPKVIRFVPPLTVRPEEISQALSTVEEILRV
jgi:acetylornithine aminotransferase